MEVSSILIQVKSSLGYPVIDVYLTDDIIKDQIEIALKKFKSNVFKKELITVPSQRSIQLDKNSVVMVTEVAPVLPDTSTYLYARNEFSLAEAMMYFNSRDTSLQTPILARMVRNQMRRVFDDKLDWSYDKESGKLLVDNAPSDISELVIATKTYYNIATIPQYAEDWMFEYIMALCKIVEGKIRSKFKESMPGAPSDGDALSSEGASEKEALNNSINDFITYDLGVRY